MLSKRNAKCLVAIILVSLIVLVSVLFIAGVIKANPKASFLKEGTHYSFGIVEDKAANFVNVMKPYNLVLYLLVAAQFLNNLIFFLINTKRYEGRANRGFFALQIIIHGAFLVIAVLVVMFAVQMAVIANDMNILPKGQLKMWLILAAIWFLPAFNTLFAVTDNNYGLIKGFPIKIGMKHN